MMPLKLKDAKPPTSFDDLPLETMVDILSRLPVKTLIRSTSVNKTWYGLIINPKFFAAQIRHSVSSCDQNAVLVVPSNIIPVQSPCALVSVETSSVIQRFRIPFDTKTSTVKIVGSLNGLICLTDATCRDACRDLYLWNPSVRRYKTLVSSCFKELVAHRKMIYCLVGLGFCEAADDYRVVRIVYRTDDEGTLYGKVPPPKVEIYSLKRNTWRKVKDPVVPRIAKEGGVFVNGRFYWLEVKKALAYFEDMWILSFDFSDEVFGELRLPDKVRHCLGELSAFGLMELEGSLAVCVHDITARNEARMHGRIWVMRHEDGDVSWTRRYDVVMDVPAWPLKITKSGKLIIESWQGLPDCRLVSCDLKNMHQKDLGFCGTSTSHACLIENLFTFGFGGGPSIVDTSFIESLILLDRGDVMLGHP